jgi:hypothetical protein
VAHAFTYACNSAVALAGVEQVLQDTPDLAVAAQALAGLARACAAAIVWCYGPAAAQRVVGWVCLSLPATGCMYRLLMGNS